MRLLIICLLWLFGNTLWAQPATVLSKEAEAVQAVILAQQKAWNLGDIRGFMDGYWENDSLTFVSVRGPKYGWHRLLESYRKSYPDNKAMGQLTFSELKINVLNREYAHVVGAWQVRTQEEAKVSKGWFTLLFRKFPLGWRIILDHTSG